MKGKTMEEKQVEELCIKANEYNLKIKPLIARLNELTDIVKNYIAFPEGNIDRCVQDMSNITVEILQISRKYISSKGE